jgi:outer membrane protein OmpA-like peptidoglycan-associated protein
LDLHPTNAGSNGGLAKVAVFQDGAEIMQNTLNTTQFNSNAAKTKIKVSIWRQKQRLRMYLNEEKVFDLPRAFVTDKKYQLVMFELANGMSGDNDKYLISNMKLAVGAPDTRNKLITEGKFSTTGILFDVNSDKIKPESYGVLKDIADILKENSDVKIKIIGHTDSDGDEKMNLELSKKRAAAVQNALIANFSISESRIQTDGMGESKPVADNNTPSGKANNRRVEFIKM